MSDQQSASSVETKARVSTTAKVSLAMSPPQTGFVPSERPQDCEICRQGRPLSDVNLEAASPEKPGCTIPSHFMRRGELDDSIYPTPPSTVATESPGVGGMRSSVDDRKNDDSCSPNVPLIVPPPSTVSAPPELSPEQTFAELVKRLRTLLSRQNVSVDPSIALLMSTSPQQLPEELCITVEALMSHPFIGSLKASKETVIDAAEAVGSHVLRVDRENSCIFPIMKAQRCTLILRDLKCEVEELRDFVAEAPALKKYTDSEPILEIRQELLGGQINWFVTLPSADDTTDTALWLRQQKFKDQDIRVAVKSESAFQSFVSRPMPTWNMEGAFVPLVPMQYGVDSGRGRGRRGGIRGGRLSRGSRGGRGPRRTFNSPPGGDSDSALRRGGRGNARSGSRFRGGGQRRGSRYPSDWFDGAERDGNMIVGEGVRDDEVDPSDFPPLMESAKLCNFGYGAREFKQYSPSTLRELRDRVHGSAEVAM
eukprot:Blabericola_migrator_1__4777@NODE_2513_length_2657_cov_386_223552_g1573_i0_p1_GENE_NODE_2513_length_2657_cov_386_223552_g1573_i0NODE_2513_length_2657_cov_386_223552_g1573_i0_p1_ORF_typecomplete_len481_score57_50_NODE_2513_length_2657_cov_386_223552_g1573_i09542396